MQRLSQFRTAEQALADKNLDRRQHMLIVGLGNPDPEHLDTRHNVGFMTVDAIASYYGISLSKKSNLKSIIGQAVVSSCKLLLAKPTSYMNLSGWAVQMILSYYKLSLANVWVIHDDIDLPMGKMKHKFSGGNGGHNGLKSIDNQLGREYNRIRIGIGRPLYKEEVSNYVLAPFTADEFKKINQLIKIIAGNLELLINNDLVEFNRAITV